MDENTKNPTAIKLITDLLAEMSQRAILAEAEVERLKADDSNWYHHWQRKDAEVKELSTKLSAEIAEHQATKEALRKAKEETGNE